jgi:hypothetical protein
MREMIRVCTRPNRRDDAVALAAVLIVAYGVAIWAMATKPA